MGRAVDFYRSFLWLFEFWTEIHQQNSMLVGSPRKCKFQNETHNSVCIVESALFSFPFAIREITNQSKFTYQVFIHY